MNRTAIEWATHTWNPTSGCRKVSEGCRNCYAKRIWLRAYGNRTGRAFEDVETHPERLAQPLAWRKSKDYRRVFVDSMSDLFHEDVPFPFIDQVAAVAHLVPAADFLVLTKRPERMREWATTCSGAPDYEGCEDRSDNVCVRAAEFQHVETKTGLLNMTDEDTLVNDWPIPNLWLGVSVEDQATADARTPVLLDTPAALRMLSVEPLLGPVDLSPYLAAGIGWVIVGGESGPQARPMNPAWVRSLRDQAAAAGVPFFFKQWGEWSPVIPRVDPKRKPADRMPREHVFGDGARVYRIGKKNAGKTLDRRVHVELPERRVAA